MNSLDSRRVSVTIRGLAGARAHGLLSLRGGNVSIWIDRTSLTVLFGFSEVLGIETTENRVSVFTSGKTFELEFGESAQDVEGLAEDLAVAVGLKRNPAVSGSGKALAIVVGVVSLVVLIGVVVAVGRSDGDTQRSDSPAVSKSVPSPVPRVERKPEPLFDASSFVKVLGKSRKEAEAMLGKRTGDVTRSAACRATCPNGRDGDTWYLCKGIDYETRYAGAEGVSISLTDGRVTEVQVHFKSMPKWASSAERTLNSLGIQTRAPANRRYEQFRKFRTAAEWGPCQGNTILRVDSVPFYLGYFVWSEGGGYIRLQDKYSVGPGRTVSFERAMDLNEAALR
jgi:hypothetical protein